MNRILLNCLMACYAEILIAQTPPVFIPVDYSNVHWGNGTSLSLVGRGGHEVLVLRKAFFWENSEQDGCENGPWAKIDAGVCHETLFQLHSLEEVKSTPSLVEAFKIGDGTKIPGPIYFADEDCLFVDHDAYSEWVDGPWGCYYSNLGVFDWTQAGVGTISLIIAEGDQTWWVFGSEDDILGGAVISKNQTGIIHIDCPGFGWVEFENIKVPSGLEQSVDVGDYYWYYLWDGKYPSNAQLEPQYLWDQYVPLPGMLDPSQGLFDIPHMEEQFPANSSIGLLGGKFPKGTLSKPMIYKAADKPAVFGQN